MTHTTLRSIRRNVETLKYSLAESRPELLQSIYAVYQPFASSQPLSLIRPGGDGVLHFGFGIPRNKYDGIFVKYKWCLVWANNTKVYNPHAYRDSTGADWFSFPPDNLDLPAEHVACGQASRNEFAL